MYLRGDIWHYDFIVGGRRYRGSTGFRKDEKSKAEAVEDKLKVQIREGHSIEMIWQQTKQRMTANKKLELSFASIWKVFMAKTHLNAVVSIKHAGKYRTVLRFFCGWMAQNHPEIQTVADVTREYANEWVEEIINAPGSPATKQHKIICITKIFRELRDYGVIENPFAGIKPLPKNHVSREAFTPEELAIIGHKATGWMYSLCLTAISTGLRKGDICLLKKENIDLETGWITLKTSKTKNKVDIPIMPSLHDHLRERFATSDSEYVYPELAQMYLKDPSIISHNVKNFLADCGITNTQKKLPGYARKASIKDIHSFRHTFVYLAAVHGIPFPIVQGIVGHLNAEMTKHYMDHAGREAKKQYLSQLPDYLSGQKKGKREIKERLIAIANKLNNNNFEKNRKRLLAIFNK